MSDIVKIDNEPQGTKASIVIVDLEKRISELEAENAELKAKAQEVCECDCESEVCNESECTKLYSKQNVDL